MIGNRLKLARSASGISLRELSNHIGNRVTAQAIGKYERDQAMPRFGVLTALADALNVPVEYLTGDPGMTLQSVDFRTKQVRSKREEDRIKARVVHMLERYLTIEEILGLPSVHWDKPRSAPYPILYDFFEADQAASRLRHDWNLGLDPIPNIVQLMEDRGVKVLFSSLSEVDGLTAHVRREGMPDAHVIVVNQDTGGERQRFTIAHEIGHLVLDVPSSMDEEKAANRFAGAFLMPEEVVWTEIGKHRSAIGWAELFNLKLLFGVSVQAITYRCKDLGIISLAQMRRMYDTFTELGWRSPPYEEPLSIPSERAGRFERLCFRAFSEGAISEAEASELLETSVSDLNHQMKSPPFQEEISSAMDITIGATDS